MQPIRLLDLGEVPAVRSQTVYHAVAHAQTADTPNTIILVSPADPYACIGFHQELEKEVDLDYCRAHNLPVYRREVGGGAVYLDNGQIFTQWVFQPGNLPANLEEQYELYVKPLLDAYQELGIDAYLRPINDIHVGGKKIGGTGAAQIGEAQVVVGSLMLNFDKATMTRILKVPSEKMRDKIFESLEAYMVTMEELLETMPSREQIKAVYVQKCAQALGAEIVPGTLTEAELAMAEKLDHDYTSDEWLFEKGSLPKMGVKIHEDVRVVETALKAPGGLIRVTARLRENAIDDVSLSGDFTLLPSHGLSAIEAGLVNQPVQPEALSESVAAVYQAEQIRSPGVTPENFAEAIMQAATGNS
jgi:lipoate-protein ligase A